MGQRVKLLPVFLFGCFVLCSIEAFAQMSWKSDKETLDFGHYQTSLSATFTFTNMGKKAISIENIQSGCACIDSVVPEDAVAPGKTGAIRVTYNLPEGDPSDNTTEMMVTFSDGTKKMLSLRTLSPSPYERSQSLLKWKVGDAINAQSTIIKPAGKVKAIRVTDVTNKNRFRFEASHVQLADGTWKVTVTPKDTIKPVTSRASVKLEYTGSDGKTFTRKTFVLLKIQQ